MPLGWSGELPDARIVAVKKPLTMFERCPAEPLRLMIARSPVCAVLSDIWSTATRL